jgi:hypothetical protein
MILGFRFPFRWIDPGGGWDRRRLGRVPLEALRMIGKGRHQGGTTLFGELIGMPIVDGVGRHQADAAVA